MSTLSDSIEFLDRLGRLSDQQRLLRAVVPVSTVVMLVLERVSGGSASPLVVVLALMLSVIAALVPDSSAPLFLVWLLGLHWAVAVPDRVSVTTLAAAAVLLFVHVACTLASYGPFALVLEPWLVVLWVRRCATVLAVTALVWLLARILSGLDLPATGWALGAALLVLIGWGGYLSRRLAEGE